MKFNSRSYAFLTEDSIRGDFSHGYDQSELWEAANTKSIEHYEMEDVKHWVYTPCWSNKKNSFISIFQVINQPRRFPGHIRRIKEANVEHPLIVVEDEYDKYGSILDGNHRFAKLLLEDYEKISIVYFTKKELEKFRVKL